jgi:predicted ArsR family transcriptional regulator
VRSDEFDSNVRGIAALGDPLRRRLYRYVVSEAAPVNRDQAAESVGVPRHTAKFHLDRLVEDGLLDVDYARPPGRGGPGAGRPAKLYHRAARDLAVSLPERDYELAGRLLAQAVTEADRSGRPVREALADAAEDAGRSLATEARNRAGTRPGRARLLGAFRSVLTECGYEPRDAGANVALVNCPFHALASEHTDLVCGMNLALLTGLVRGLGEPGVEAILDPAPDRCCVVIHKAASRARP